MPEIDEAEYAALKAVNRGDATPEMQQRALDWIIKGACRIGALSFQPDNPNTTSFNEGRRFVGVILTAILTEPIDNILTTPKTQTRRKNA